MERARERVVKCAHGRVVHRQRGGAPCRNLVLHLAHFAAPRKHLENYQEEFMSCGCDVMTCSTPNPVDVFIPSRGEKVRRIEADRPPHSRSPPSARSTEKRAN